MYGNDLELSHMQRFFVPVTFLAVLTIFTTAKAQQDIPMLSQSEEAKNIFTRQLNSAPANFREYVVEENASNAQTIQLRRKFLGSQKFVYGGKKPQSVYGFLGISYRKEFQEALSIHPAALREVKKAAPYRVAGTVGLLTLVGLSVKIFIDAVDQSQDISAGRLSDNSSGGSNLALVFVAGGVTIISGILGNKHLKNGVRMFNEKQKLSSRTTKK